VGVNQFGAKGDITPILTFDCGITLALQTLACTATSSQDERVVPVEGKGDVAVGAGLSNEDTSKKQAPSGWYAVLVTSFSSRSPRHAPLPSPKS
jgi:hypothetical protein